jgi:hypothetical protein
MYTFCSIQMQQYNNVIFVKSTQNVFSSFSGTIHSTVVCYNLYKNVTKLCYLQSYKYLFMCIYTHTNIQPLSLKFQN